jgi:serine/threonine protein kinase
VAGTDEARLVDFDLSGPVAEAFKKPLRVGTLPYLAPEQVLGQSPGPEADVYAAGVILYWIISGKHPFVGAPEEVLLGHLKAPVPPFVAWERLRPRVSARRWLKRWLAWATMS